MSQLLETENSRVSKCTYRARSDATGLLRNGFQTRRRFEERRRVGVLAEQTKGARDDDDWGVGASSLSTGNTDTFRDRLTTIERNRSMCVLKTSSGDGVGIRR